MTILAVGLGATACQGPPADGPGDPTSTTTSTIWSSTSTTATSTTTTAPAAPARRIDLQVLLVTGDDVGSAAMRDVLRGEGVPWVELDLLDPDRPEIDAAFLADTVGGVRRSRFQAVVLPTATPPGMDQSELDAVAAVQHEFGIRTLATYTYPTAAVGLDTPGFSGSLDGAQGQLTTEALDGAWGYLRGAITFDDVDPTVTETYGYLARPSDGGPGGSTFDPLLELSEPGGASGAAMGVHRRDGREQLVITASLNSFQRQLLVLGPGIVDWLTRGVHLGARQNHLTVHADDVLVPNNRWSAPNDCTASVDCPDDVDLPTIRMDERDATALASWQEDHDFLIDIVANGEGSALDRAADSSFTGLTEQFLRRRHEFRWINHTWSHEYLGCERDWSVSPWVCETDDDGVVWVPRDLVDEQIERNLSWAGDLGIDMDRGELVTGEHSGLRRAPEEPSDNPHLMAGLADADVRVVASDASRELRQRRLGGSVLTLPRYPFNLFYNTARHAEQVDEYNWIYTSATDGGSGICEADASSTCIEPLDPETGFDSYIRPLEVQLASLRTLNGLPFPHYAHQSDLTEDRMLLDVVGDLLAWYRSTFETDTPLVNPTMGDAATLLEHVQAWRDSLDEGSPEASAHLLGDTLVVESSPGTSVPLTVPDGSTADGQPVGAPYGTGSQAWSVVPPGGSTTIDLGALGV